MRNLKIAVDGPSGAGKSSLARALARELGLLYLDTGALYRAIGLYMTDHGVDVHDAAAVGEQLPGVKLELSFRDGVQSVLLCGEDVGDRIRTPEMSLAASAVSAIPAVREFLLGIQRDMATRGSIVMDGRDIGTVIMPDAELKIFITATPEERARRRYRELSEKGQVVSYDDVLENIIARDKQDSERETAPLKPAEDAVVFVNDGFSLDESIDTVYDLMKRRAEAE